MDQRLAEIYGTNQETEADVEKLAAAQLAEELEDDDGIDLVEPVEVLEGSEVEEPAEGEEEEQEAAGEEGEEDDGETMKLAEADFEQADTMGRIMAHAFVQESREIEKEAGALSGAASKVERFARKAGKKTLRGVEWVGKKLTPKKVEEKVQKSGKMGMLKRMRKGGMKPSEIQETIKSHAGKRAIQKNKVRRTRNLRRTVGGSTIGTGALAAEEGTRRAISKEASAIETLATQRAEEMLAAAQTETNPYDVLSTVVEQRAVEILAENGYEVTEE